MPELPLLLLCTLFSPPQTHSPDIANTTFTPVEILSSHTQTSKCPESKNTAGAGATSSTELLTLFLAPPTVAIQTHPPLNQPIPSPLLNSSLLHFIQPRSNSPMNNGWMDGWVEDFHLSRFSFFPRLFLLRDGCSANAGQHALEMSPGTSHSVCLSVCCLKDL